MEASYRRSREPVVRSARIRRTRLSSATGALGGMPPRRAPSAELRVGRYARLDRGRPHRIGLPEVILAEGKSTDHLLGILSALAERKSGALVSRPTDEQRRALVNARAKGLPTRELAGGRVVRLAGPLGVKPLAGTVAILAAGTSDVALAEEARAILDELGVRIVRAYDVGVAGLHRLLHALRRVERHGPAVYLVFAGREGALPTVVSGLVRAPVVGVPTSVGYGRGSSGEAALLAMLQSCAPIAVVNIDAAVPAALFAAHHLVRSPGRRKRSREGSRRARA